MMWLSGVRSSWRSCAPGSLLTAPRSRAGRPPELRLDLLEQPGEIDGLGVEVVAARCDRLLPVARHGVRGERDHRDRAGLRGGLDPAGRLPAVQARQAHVHQDERGRLRARHRHPLLAVDRDGDLVAAPGEPTGEHVPVHLVVLDEQDLGHQARGLRRATLAETSSRTSASSWSRPWVPFWRIFCTWPLSRSRSSWDRSLAVTTTIGMARQASWRRNSATNSKPSISGIIRSSRITLGRTSARRSSATRPFSASTTV